MTVHVARALRKIARRGEGGGRGDVIQTFAFVSVVLSGNPAGEAGDSSRALETPRNYRSMYRPGRALYQCQRSPPLDREARSRGRSHS